MSSYSEKLRKERRAQLALRALPSEFAATKTEAGESFPAAAYAYVPDAEMPSTWKLRLWATPNGGPDTGIVGAAIAALGPGGFRGNKVQIPAADLPAVKAKVKAAWLKADPSRKEADVPAVVACGDMMGHGMDEPIDGDDDFLEALLKQHNEVLDIIDGYDPADSDVADYADKTETAVRQSSADIYNLLAKLVVSPQPDNTATPQGPMAPMAPYGYSIESEEFGTLPPALAAQIVKKLKADLAKEKDPTKKAALQAKIDKYTK